MQNRIRCSLCDQRLEPEAFAPSHRREGAWCRACRKDYMARYNAARYETERQRRRDTPRDCRICGVSFTRWDNCEHPGSAANRCQPCYREYVRKRKNPKPKRQRLTDEEYLAATLAKYPHKKAMQLLRSGSRWQSVRARFIAQLDAFDCGFCGEPVDMELSGMDRMGPTVDHITPVALGGAFYDHENLRIAHRSCNSKGGRQHERAELLAIQGAARWIGDRLSA